jgi:cytochrome P450
MKPLDEAPFLDFLDPEFVANPAPVIDAFRRQSSIVRTPIGALVLEHAKVLELLGDPRLRSSLLDFVRLQGMVDGPIYEAVSNSLLAVDGQDHTRLRKLVSRAFTPRSVERLRPSMRALAESLAGRFVPSGRCEFMADFADHYPIQLICELLGVPPEDHDRFGRWSNAITWVLSLELLAHLDEVAEGFLGLGNYIEAFIEERRARPRDDLVTALIQAEDGGDRLSGPELRSLIASLLFAGFDTTRNQLGIDPSFRAVPGAVAAAGAAARVEPNAVEEILRFQGTVAVAPRVAYESPDVGGYHVPGRHDRLALDGGGEPRPRRPRASRGLDVTIDREPRSRSAAATPLSARTSRGRRCRRPSSLAARMPDVRSPATSHGVRAPASSVRRCCRSRSDRSSAPA